MGSDMQRGSLRLAFRLRQASWVWRVAWKLAFFFTGVLFLLALIEGTAFSDQPEGLIHDYVVLNRLLFAMPFFWISGRLVDKSLAMVSRYLVASQIIQGPDARDVRAKLFHIHTRVLTSRWALVAIVTLSLVWIPLTLRFNTFDASSWIWAQASTPWSVGRFSLAGAWYLYVCVTLFRIAALHNVWRWAVWLYLIVKASIADLKLSPIHPDRAGGTAFLGQTSLSFAGTVMGISSLLSSSWLSDIHHRSAVAQDFVPSIIGLVLVMMLLFLGPLLFWVPKLFMCKAQGLRRFGILNNRIAQIYEQKWAGESDIEPIFSTNDPSVASDANAVYDHVEEMSIAPFGRTHVLGIVIATLLPMIPLPLTVLPLKELLGILFKAIF